jgi:hypothetical protein
MSAIAIMNVVSVTAHDKNNDSNASQNHSETAMASSAVVGPVPSKAKARLTRGRSQDRVAYLIGHLETVPPSAR